MISDQIDQDIKEALKAKDAPRVSILRFLKAALHNMEISKKVDKLEDADTLQVISKLIKQHHESIEGFKKGKREDLVAKETRELEILKQYTPPEADREEIMMWVRAVVQETGAQGIQDLGKVMKGVMSKAQGRADGKVINEVVREVLGGP
jgi:uncharacterized protein YqeY